MIADKLGWLRDREGSTGCPIHPLRIIRLALAHEFSGLGEGGRSTRAKRVLNATLPPLSSLRDKLVFGRVCRQLNAALRFSRSNKEYNERKSLRISSLFIVCVKNNKQPVD